MLNSLKGFVLFFMMLFLIFVHAGGVFSMEYTMAELESEIEAEIQWIKEEAVVMTEIATKTNMDADLVPGMVTILEREYLEKQGVRTVYEALSLVPGLNTSKNSIGDQIVSVRGIGGNFFSGNLKIMLDSIAMNDSLSAAGYALYQIPIEQIERIEIIRGPGSVIYGEYAYAGVINVVTRKQGNRIYGTYDSNETYGGGGTASYDLPEKDFNISLSLSGLKGDGPDVDSGQDRLYGMGLGDFSYAPGSVNMAEKDKFANLALKYKDFSFSGQYLYSGRGDYFGIINVLPPPEDSVKIYNEHMAIEARQQKNLFNFLKADFKAGWREYEYDMDDLIALPAVAIPMPDGSVFQMTPVDGSIAGPHYEEREFYAGMDFIWNGIERNNLLLGMKYSDIEIGDVFVDTNTADQDWGVMTRLHGENNWLMENQKRRIFSVYFQDLYEISDNITLTPGLRYDHYDDMGDYLTPRLSGVWRMSNNHILKAQYSESYRPPTFTELYARENTVVKGNPDLESEHIRSYELGYTYRKQKTAAHITLFWSELEDNIEYPAYADQFSGDTVQYRNAGDTVTARGLEVEFAHNIRHDLRLDFNLSFADTENGETGEEIEGAADWLGNIGLMYMPVEDYAFSIRYHYAGERHRAGDDTRDNLDAYDTFDISANKYNLFTKGLTLRAGVKNLFNSNIVYPAAAYKDEEGNIGFTYKDDCPQEDRRFWVLVSYDFK